MQPTCATARFDWRFVALLLLCVLLGGALRMTGLGARPAGFSHDEASNGYDAWSLWQTGKSRNGEAWPIFFNSFGDYNEGLYRYLLAPCVAGLGLKERVVRLPAALAGTATIVFVALLGRRMFSPGAGLFAALLYALMPWHVGLSRVGMRMMLLPLFLIVGLWLTVRWAQRGGRPWPLLLLAVWWGFTWYTYTAVRVVLPPLLLVLVVAHWRPLLRQWRWSLAALGIFVALSLPMALMYLGNSDMLNARAAAVSWRNMPLADDQVWSTLFWQYLSHFGPGFLFRHGDANPVWSPVGVGQLYWFALPLILLGLARLVRMWNRYTVLFAVWLLVAPLPSALTTWAPHAHRAVACEPAWSLLAGLGLAWLWHGYRHGPRRMTAAIVLLLVLAGALVEAPRFVWRHAAHDGADTQQFFPLRIGRAMQALHGHAWRADRVLVTNEIHRPEAHYLFFGAVPPAHYHELRANQGLPKESDPWLVHVGPMWFARPQALRLPNAIFLMRLPVPEQWQPAVRWSDAHWAVVEGNQALAVKTLTAPDGTPWQLGRWRFESDARRIYLVRYWDDPPARGDPPGVEGFEPVRIERGHDPDTNLPWCVSVHDSPRPASGTAWEMAGWGQALAQESLHARFGMRYPELGLEVVEWATGEQGIALHTRWRLLASRDRLLQARATWNEQGVEQVAQVLMEHASRPQRGAEPYYPGEQLDATFLLPIGADARGVSVSLHDEPARGPLHALDAMGLPVGETWRMSNAE